MSRTLSLKTLQWGEDLRSEDLPQHEIDFLRQLGGPTIITVPGADPTRTRVVTTLLHGNEPSGLRAIHRWLLDGRHPATHTLFFIACVDTALTEPHFFHRHLPDRRDFNRCFREPWDDPEGQLAEELLAVLLAAEPECLVDLHNNTGHNPAYGVAVQIGEAELGLVSIWADRVVHAPLALGTIVEATVEHFPSVTVECGRSGDPAADDVARAGLGHFLEQDDLMLDHPERPMRILCEPIRVCLSDHISLAFDDTPHPEAELTVSADIDRHNFELMPTGSSIGWLRADAGWPLDARRPDGSECSREIFRVHEGRLETRRDFVPIMMTTRPEIAQSDCLFYAAQEGGWEEFEPASPRES